MGMKFDDKQQAIRVLVHCTLGPKALVYNIEYPNMTNNS